MPFYDLKCGDCKTESNISATMSDKTERRIPCPSCGSLNMDTVYASAPAYLKNVGDKISACPNSGSCGARAGCQFGG